MATSKTIKISSSDTCINEVLREADAFARYMNLTEKEALRLRLLSEEAVGMVVAIAGDFEADFTISAEGKACSVNLETETIVDIDKREEFLALSTSGKNESAKGFMGKVRDVFTRYLFTPDPVQTVPANTVLMMGLPDPSVLGGVWSLSNYRMSIEENGFKEKTDAWDELEKSIVGNIADEVKIGIRGIHVFMSIEKKFGEDE